MSQGLTDRLASPWSRLWQVPLFAAALVLFAIGVRQFYQAQVRKQPGFEVHVADINTLLQQKQYERALQQIAAVQGHFTARAQQGALEELAGHAFYLAQQEQPAVVEENYRKAIEHYQRAVRLGAAETPLIKLRWGLGALWLKDYPTATARLEAVVQEEPGRLAELARPLVGAYLAMDPRADAKAMKLLEKLTAAPGLDDRVWALARRLELASGSPAVLDRAVADAAAALPGIAERDPAGILLCGLGRAEFERGRLDEAEKYLRDARSRFVEHHMEDGRAALLLGRIMQARGKLDEAGALFQEVITSHAGTSLMAAARLGRAEVTALEAGAGEQMQADYRFAIKQLTAVPRPKAAPELVSLEGVRASLFTQHQRCVKAGRSADALVFVALQEELKEPEAPDFAFRKAQSYELLAEKLFAQAAAALPAQRGEIFQQALTAAGSAAEAYLRHAKLTTISNDELSGDSQWKAAQLFDRAGRTEDSIRQYKEFIAQRPEDRKSRVPEGLHRIGLLYQSLGKFDQAIPAFQRNMREHPKTTWSYASTVQLARCYMAQGEPEFPKAEQTLLSIVQESADLMPSANEFRVSLFTLGELYYRTRRWSDAILRLEEAIARYPEDRAVPRATFWLADAYRKSAADIAEALVKDPQMERRDQLEQARQARLRRAGGLFAQVIADLDGEPGREAGGAAGGGGVEEEYLRYAYLYRADCSYDLGEYTGAIKLYDQAATRFATELTAVAAYVQVVNAYLALKEPAQAQAAAERARWILKRIPDEAFGKGPLALSRQYYEDFLKLGRSVP